jgi:hypothetical protein
MSLPTPQARADDPVLVVEEETPVNADPFDGTWKLSATPDDDSLQLGAKAFDDEVQFHNALFTTSSFAMMGFPMVDYAVAGTRSRTLSTTTTSADWGTLVLEGSVDVDGILRATLTWTRPDGHTYRYSVRGEKT